MSFPALVTYFRILVSLFNLPSQTPVSACQTLQQPWWAPHHLTKELWHHFHHPPRQPLPSNPQDTQPGGHSRAKWASRANACIWSPPSPPSPPYHPQVLQPEPPPGAQGGALCHAECQCSCPQPLPFPFTLCLPLPLTGPGHSTSGPAALQTAPSCTVEQVWCRRVVRECWTRGASYPLHRAWNWRCASTCAHQGRLSWIGGDTGGAPDEHWACTQTAVGELRSLINSRE